MPPNIPDDLSHNEFSLLMHLSVFDSPAYLEDIFLTFRNAERNKAELLKLLESLKEKQYVYTLPVIDSLESIAEGYDHVLYVLSDLGRNTATYDQLFDKAE